MLQRIEIASSYSNAPNLPLSSDFVPNNDPVQIRSIEGLGPVKAEIASTPFATGRGDLYQGSSTGKRNIVMTLGLNPNWVDQTMASLRQLLYRYFMVETWATLRFFTDELPVVTIRGVVESFEPNIFAEDPEIQISILCPKPDFFGVDATLVRGTVDDGSNEIVIDYEGTAPTGFELRIQSTPALVSYSGNMDIINQAMGVVPQVFRLRSIQVSPSIYLQLNTVRSTRRVYSVTIPGAVEVNILAKMETDSNWPEFLPGENLLSVGADLAGQKWTLAYFNRFGGL